MEILFRHLIIWCKPFAASPNTHNFCRMLDRRSGIPLYKDQVSFKAILDSTTIWQLEASRRHRGR